MHATRLRKLWSWALQGGWRLTSIRRPESDPVKAYRAVLASTLNPAKPLTSGDLRQIFASSYKQQNRTALWASETSPGMGFILAPSSPAALAV